MGIMRAMAACAILLWACAPPVLAADGKAGVSDRQVSVMMFVDYGRSYGYQTMLASIEIDVIKAQIERDQQLLDQKQKLYAKRSVPLIELEIAQLKGAWNRKQLIVAEKTLATVAAQYEAMKEMAKHFAGVEVSPEHLYAIFRRAWDAGCEKGPDEVVAMKAWADFSKLVTERARQLNRSGRESLSSLLEKEVQLTTAQTNYQQRAARLDRCRQVLFPDLAEIMAVAR